MDDDTSWFEWMVECGDNILIAVWFFFDMK